MTTDRRAFDAAHRYRLRLILAKHPDDEQPTIIGCMDETVWEHIDEEYEERWRRQAQRDFGDQPGYEYREAWASFKFDDLVNVFAEFELFGEVANVETD